MWPLRRHRHDGKSPALPGSPEILAIIKSSQDRAAVANFATSNSGDVTIVETLDDAAAISARPCLAVIILDRDLAEGDWRSTVRALAQRRPAPCVILASPVLDDYLFEEIVKQGGFDIVAKPIRPDELRRVASLALAFWKSRLTNSPNE